MKFPIKSKCMNEMSLSHVWYPMGCPCRMYIGFPRLIQAFASYKFPKGVCPDENENGQVGKYRQPDQEFRGSRRSQQNVSGLFDLKGKGNRRWEGEKKWNFHNRIFKTEEEDGGVEGGGGDLIPRAHWNGIKITPLPFTNQIGIRWRWLGPCQWNRIS